MVVRAPAVIVCLIAAVAALLTTAVSQGHPRPSAIPQRWELRFEPGDLRLYMDNATGRVYWYFTYKVTNLTERDQVWAPEFTLFFDNGEILVSGRDVPSEVTGDLLALLNNEYLQEQNELIGEIRPGEGQALEGLVIWPATDFQVSRVVLFVAGISGDTSSLPMPNGGSVLLRKTLQRDYLVPGNALARRREPMEMLETRWIFR